GNVLPGALFAVVPREMVGKVVAGATEGAGLAVLGRIEHVAGLQEIAEQRREVLDLDVAVDVGLREADGAAAQGLGDDAEVVDVQHRMLAGARRAEGARLAVGEVDGDRAMPRAADQMLADPRREGRREARPKRGPRQLPPD